MVARMRAYSKGTCEMERFDLGEELPHNQAAGAGGFAAAQQQQRSATLCRA
jgi:hypothetical protein